MWKRHSNQMLKSGLIPVPSDNSTVVANQNIDITVTSAFPTNRVESPFPVKRIRKPPERLQY